MANSILSSIFSQSSFSIINDITGFSMWTGIKVKDIEIIPEAMTTDNPVSTSQYSESGTYVSLLETDIESIKIIRPSRMRLTGYCDDISTIESIINDFLNQKLTISVTTKSVIIDSMMIVNVDMEQTPLMLSATGVSIEFEQAQPPIPANGFSPAQSSDSSTYGIRIQTPPSLTLTASALYNKVSNFIGAL